MHVATALKGIKKEDRCPNWQKGSNYPCGKVENSNAGGGLFSFWK